MGEAVRNEAAYVDYSGKLQKTQIDTQHDQAPHPKHDRKADKATLE